METGPGSRIFTRSQGEFGGTALWRQNPLRSSLASTSVDEMLEPTCATVSPHFEPWPWLVSSASGLLSEEEGPSLPWTISPGPFVIQHLLSQVKKIHENEKRLEAGDHPVELLARDFEKNYNMYIFPVHWQFGQLDQHPIDG